MKEHDLEDLWGELRSLLHSPPKPQTWRALNALIDANPITIEHQDMFEYIRSIVSRWPPHIRVTPKPWIGMMLVGHTSRYFELCARLELISLTEPEDELRQADYWEHPLLDVSEGSEQHWALEVVEDGPHTGFIDFLWEHPAIGHIQELDLSNNSKRYNGWWENDRAVDAGAESLTSKQLELLVSSPHLTGLRSLSLSECGLDQHHMSALTTNADFRARIQTLDLSENFFSDEDGFTQLLVKGRVWPSLTSLNLRNVHLKWSWVAELLTSANFPALREIDLAYGFDARDTRIPQALDITLPNLERLDLSGFDLVLSNGRMKTPTSTSPFIQALQSGDISPSLRSLRLSRTKLGPKELKQLTEASWFGQLELLDISHNDATLGAGHAVELIEASGHPTDVIASKQPGEAVEHERFQWLPGAPSDLSVPEAGSSWWAWMYDQPTFAGHPIQAWNGSEIPLDAQPPRPTTTDTVHVPRVHLDKHSPPSLDIDRCPAPVEGMISVGTSQDPEGMVKSFIDRFGKSHQRRLEMLTWHDVSDVVEQPSWLNNSDVAPLLEAFPNLRFFGVKGGNGLRFGAERSLRHDTLEALTIITGGLPEIIIQDLIAASLPSLQALELWFGVPYYGLTTKIEDLEPIFRNQRADGGVLFPALTQLGLCNCTFGDQLIDHLIDAPIMRRLDTLDMRNAGITDLGLRRLIDSGAADHLRRVLLDKNLLSDRALADTLSLRGVSVSWGDWQHARTDSWDYYVEVAE